MSMQLQVAEEKETTLNDLFYEESDAGRRQRNKQKYHRFRLGGRQPARKHENGGGWVALTAAVSPEVYVGPSAEVSGTANVIGKVEVRGKVAVHTSDIISRNGNRIVLSGSGLVSDGSQIIDSATIKGHIRISRSVVSGTSLLQGDVRVLDGAQVHSSTIVGCATVREGSIVRNSTLHGTCNIDERSTISACTISGCFLCNASDVSACSINTRHGEHIYSTYVNPAALKTLTSFDNASMNIAQMVRGKLVKPKHAAGSVDQLVTALTNESSLVVRPLDLELRMLHMVSRDDADNGSIRCQRFDDSQPGLITSIVGRTCGIVAVNSASVLHRCEIYASAIINERCVLSRINFRNTDVTSHMFAGGQMTPAGALAHTYNALLPPNATAEQEDDSDFPRELARQSDFPYGTARPCRWHMVTRHSSEIWSNARPADSQILQSITKRQILNNSNNDKRSNLVTRLSGMAASCYAYFLPSGTQIVGDGRGIYDLSTLFAHLDAQNREENRSSGSGRGQNNGSGRPANATAAPVELYDPRGSRVLRSE